MFSELAKKVYELTNESDNRKSLDIAIETANELIKILDPKVSDLKSGEDALDENIPINKFPNYKAESWFAQHPYFTGERVALNFYESDTVQIKFYWLGDTATKSRVSAGVMLSSNWEDSDLTRNEQYKVGIDFFLSSNTKSLLMVVSNNGNLRILEFNSRLSNTQQEILQKLRGVIALESKEQIHKTIWDALALSEVNKKFYQGIAEKFNELLNHLIADGKDAEDSKLFASRLLGRLLFIWFLRRKNIIQEQYGYFEIDGPDSTEYYDQKLKKLFFNTLNTPASDRQHSDDKTPYLNGGLFEAHDNDWANQKVSFPTGFFNRLYDHLEQYNFTTDESSPEYEQVAIDPEMLGRVFESLLATQITETGDQARKAKGAFYTPREIVSYMCKESLRQYLYTKLDNEIHNEGIDKLLDISDSEWELQHTNAKRNLWGEKDRNTIPAKVMQALDELNVLDPACGSGAFPMGMLQIMLKTYERLDNRFDIYKTKLRIIQENIFGVDIEPMAVEISRLRAWLSLVVDDEDDNQVEPLPNLDFKFVCANSLLPLEQQTGLFSDASLHEKLAEVRIKFFNARVPNSKDKWKKEYYRLTDDGQHSFLSDQRESQLKSFDPFKNSQPAKFFDADYMFGIPKFDVVIGNPPYIHTRTKSFDRSNIDILKKLFRLAVGQFDYFALFTEKAEELLIDGGVYAYIIPRRVLSNENHEPVRKFYLESLGIVSYLDAKMPFESAAVEANVLVAQKGQKTEEVKIYEYSSDKTIKHTRQINIKLASSLPFNSFGFSLTKSEIKLLHKIQSVSGELKNFLTISRGYEFGYNHKSISTEPTTTKLIKSEDIQGYNLSYSGLYVKLDEVEKSKQKDVFIAPKLVTKFVSNDLKFSLDTVGYHNTNAVYNLYAKSKNIDIMSLLPILNSKLISFWFQKSFLNDDALFPHIQKNQLEMIPIKRGYDRLNLGKVSQEVINAREAKERHRLESEADITIYSLYGLTPEEIEIVENSSKKND